ncbi:hypothetical protein B5E77_07320 [Lachnoclostridium sp. An131]|nr:hypothetical protein B5E77_07320 [Lachnoclostridium sp. An131]
MFLKMVQLIHTISKGDFKEAVKKIRELVDNVNYDDLCEITKNIGMIPENIEHDSSEEKMYSKASDIILARCFRELGLAARALDERADSADILAESIRGYNYSLVADAKCFRLSRTAKNQKDFKVSNLSDWRGSENEYAVLVAPYFQYPQTKSQIYSKALEHNVCLLTWEHLSLLLKYNVKETEIFSLESLWNASQMMARDKKLAYANAQMCFLPKMDELIAKKIGIDMPRYHQDLEKYKTFILYRGRCEIGFWEKEIEKIKEYSREKAIEELIAAKKLNEKIGAIKGYLSKLKTQE